MLKPRKRFIADARCPACHQQDVLRWWEFNQIEYVECVACDYQEQRAPESVAQSSHKSDHIIGVFKPD